MEHGLAAKGGAIRVTSHGLLKTAQLRRKHPQKPRCSTLFHARQPHCESDFGSRARKILFPDSTFSDSIGKSIAASEENHMVRAVSPSRLEAYRKQQVELAKKIKEAEGRQKRELIMIDGHRKHLAGAVALKELEANPDGEFASALLHLLEQGLTRPNDRKLFNLPPLPKDQPASAPKQATAAEFADAGGGTIVGNG
jgi:hypothetical protein